MLALLKMAKVESDEARATSASNSGAVFCVDSVLAVHSEKMLERIRSTLSISLRGKALGVEGVACIGHGNVIQSAGLEHAAHVAQGLARVAGTTVGDGDRGEPQTAAFVLLAQVRERDDVVIVRVHVRDDGHGSRTAGGEQQQCDERSGLTMDVEELTLDA
ncbi:hypothetical protein [Archangium violaceum]|uniref:hypothetical protein n=1 Tax=Archangium violaceum TaxID=83451 RepID=UPI001EF0AE2B|nr:hypothetical protein [Archangium violaceum]